MNIVVISGNLTKEPETRTTASGSTQLSIGVAVNERRKNAQTGEWEDHPQFIDCVVYGNRASSLSKMLHKGMKVHIEGKLRSYSWEDADTGKKRYKTDVVVNNLELPPRSSDGYIAHDEHAEAKANAYQPDAYEDDEIPF